MSDARESMAGTGQSENPASGRRSEQADTVSDARETADAGLQSERTRLSWSRTALSLGAVGGLVVHTANSPAEAVAGVALILLALVSYGIGVARYRFLARTVQVPGPVAAPRALGLVATCAALATPAALLGFFH